MFQEVDRCLFEFVKRAKEIVEKGLNKGEANVTNFLVNPLLHCLGWDTTNPEYIRPQYPIRMGTATKFADYALLSDGKPVCLIEVKDGDLTEDDVGQLLSYCNAESVMWGLLTNGVEVWFYDASERETEKSLIFKINILEDSEKRREIISYLRRSHLCSPEAPKNLRQVGLRRRAIVVAKSEAKTLIQQITEWFKDQLDVDSIPQDAVKEAIRQVFGFPPPQGPKPSEEIKPPAEPIVTTARDWKYAPHLGKGVFLYKGNQNMPLDVSKRGPEVETQLKNLGLRCSSPSAFGAFYYTLRRRANLIRR